MEKKQEKKIIAMSRKFVRARIRCNELSKWSCIQNKLFSIILSKIDWKNGNNSNWIELQPDEVFQALGWNVKREEYSRFMNKVKHELEYMLKHSAITVDNPYTKTSTSDNLITHLQLDNTSFYIVLSQDFMPHFENLYSLAKETKLSFITFFLAEEMSFKSKFALSLLLELRSCGSPNGSIITHSLSTKQLH